MKKGGEKSEEREEERDGKQKEREETEDRSKRKSEWSKGNRRESRVKEIVREKRDACRAGCDTEIFAGGSCPNFSLFY